MDQNGCCGLDESEIMVVRDLNMAAPHKGGNQFSRICPECGTRKFCTRRYWETNDEQYVIPNGEKEPVQLFDCPYPDCDGEIHEGLDECPDCGSEIEWVDEDEDDPDESESTMDDESETQEVANA